MMKYGIRPLRSFIAAALSGLFGTVFLIMGLNLQFIEPSLRLYLAPLILSVGFYGFCLFFIALAVGLAIGNKTAKGIADYLDGPW